MAIEKTTIPTVTEPFPYDPSQVPMVTPRPKEVTVRCRCGGVIYHVDVPPIHVKSPSGLLYGWTEGLEGKFTCPSCKTNVYFVSSLIPEYEMPSPDRLSPDAVKAGVWD
jgi:hypothetical protein